jgi:hypothetical protein
MAAVMRIYRNVFQVPAHVTGKPLETTRFTIFKTLEDAIKDGQLSPEYLYTISYEVEKHLPELSPKIRPETSDGRF